MKRLTVNQFILKCLRGEIPLYISVDEEAPKRYCETYRTELYVRQRFSDDFSSAVLRFDTITVWTKTKILFCYDYDGIVRYAIFPINPISGGE